MATRRLTIVIEGLDSTVGSLAVEQALAQTPGVLLAFVSPATEMAYIAYDPALVSTGPLITAIELAGFRAGELRPVL